MPISKAFPLMLSLILPLDCSKAITSKDENNEALRITPNCSMISKKVCEDLGMELASKSYCKGM